MPLQSHILHLRPNAKCPFETGAYCLTGIEFCGCRWQLAPLGIIVAGAQRARHKY